MAKKLFLADIDLNNNQLLNVTIQNLATAPTGKNTGFIYYNTTDKFIYLWNGTAWISLVYIHPSFTAGTYDTENNVIKSISINNEGHVTSVTQGVLTAVEMAALINDTTSVTSTTWSSSKIKNELDAINSSIAGGLINKGGYDAASNIPSLDTTPIAGIKNGWTYVITAPGNFFTEGVQVGDMIISKQDNPTALAHWTIVNKNIPDIVNASETASGIIEIATQAETNTATDDTRAVTPLKLKNYFDSRIATGAYTATFGNGALTTYAITHNLNSKFLNVNIYEEATGQEVIADYAATSANVLTINVNIAPTTNQYRVVIQK